MKIRVNRLLANKKLASRMRAFLLTSDCRDLFKWIFRTTTIWTIGDRNSGNWQSFTLGVKMKPTTLQMFDEDIFYSETRFLISRSIRTILLHPSRKKTKSCAFNHLMISKTAKLSITKWIPRKTKIWLKLFIVTENAIA